MKAERRFGASPPEQLEGAKDERVVLPRLERADHEVRLGRRDSLEVLAYPSGPGARCFEVGAQVRGCGLEVDSEARGVLLDSLPRRVRDRQAEVGNGQEGVEPASKLGHILVAQILRVADRDQVVEERHDPRLLAVGLAQRVDVRGRQDPGRVRAEEHVAGAEADGGSVLQEVLPPPLLDPAIDLAQESSGGGKACPFEASVCAELHPVEPRGGASPLRHRGNQPEGAVTRPGDRLANHPEAAAHGRRMLQHLHDDPIHPPARVAAVDV